MAGNLLTGVVKITAPGAVQELNNLGVSINKTGAALKGLQSPSNSATQSLTNLGRVVQDLPYGIQGFANNLNPAVEGIQRLITSSGGLKGALGALGKSLVGPAGIGIAVSVVSSLLITFGDRLFGASKAAKEADEANQKLAQGLSDDLVKLTALVGVVQNVTTSTEDRGKALRALNQEYGTYLDALGKEEISLGNVSAAYDKIVDAMIRQAVVKGLQDEISKSIAETAKQIIILEKAQIKKGLTVKGVTAQGITQEEKLQQAIKTTSQTVSGGLDGIRDRTLEIKGSVGPTETFTDAQKRLTEELKAQLAPLLQLTNNFEDLDIKLSKLKDAKIGPLLDGVTKTGIQVEAQVELQISPEELREAERKLQLKAILDFQSPEREVQRAKLTELFKGFEVPVVVKPVVDANKLQALNEIFKGIGKTIADNLAGAFNAFIDAVASGANVFKSFGQFVKSVIKSIITDLIKAVALAGILSLLGLGGGANPANFLQSLGKIFGGARAGGGPVSGGKGYIVGENGPEWFMPNTSGAIIPNGGSFGNMPGAANMSGNVVFTIAGSTLRGVLAIANQSASRLS